MTVENVTYIDDLDPAYPDGTDSISEGDNHIRNLKKSIKATFPSVKSEVPLVVKGDGVTGFESSTEFGAGPDSNHNFVGDVFVGYDSPIAQPDKQNGTLLCARGVLIGRGGAPGEASIGMEGNIIWGLGDAQADDHAVSYGFLKKQFSGIEIDTNVSNGEEDGETIAWNAAAEQWQRNELLKVQPADMEVVVDGMMVSQPALIEQSTGNNLGQVQGHNGFYLRSRRFENANDPWSGTSNQTWEIASIEPRDDAMEPSRRNGIDLTSDRVTMRVTADWSATDWYETQIVFRADGEEVEIGARNNTTSIYTNGDVYVGHQPGNRPNNNDVADGTLFVKQGIIVGRGNSGGASIGMEDNIIWGLADPTDDTCAVSKDWLENRSGTSYILETHYDELVKHALQIDNHENRLDAVEPKVEKNKSDIASLQSSQSADNQQITDMYNEQIRQAVVIDNHENRLDRAEPKINKLEQDVSELQASDISINPISGDLEATAPLNLKGNRLYGLPAPTRADDAVTLSYFEANAGSGGTGPADNVVNGSETGQLLGWNGTDKYVPQSFVKFRSGPDRLEAQNLWVISAPSNNKAVVNKEHLDSELLVRDEQITDLFDEAVRVSLVLNNHENRIDALEPAVANNASDIADLKSSQSADNQQISDLFDEQVRQAVVIGNHENRLDAVEPKVEKNKSDIANLSSDINKNKSDIANLQSSQSADNQQISDLFDEQVRQAMVISSHKDRLDAVEPKVEKNKSDIASLQSSQAADNQQISDLLDEQVRQSSILVSHDNRLDALEPKVAANESGINSLSATVTSHGNTIGAHENRLDGIDYILDAHYNELVKHSLQIQQLQNATRQAVRGASNFDEFKQAMLMLIDNLSEEAK